MCLQDGVTHLGSMWPQSFFLKHTVGAKSIAHINCSISGVKSKIFSCDGFRPIDDFPLPTSYAYFRVKVTSHVGHLRLTTDWCVVRRSAQVLVLSSPHTVHCVGQCLYTWASLNIAR